MISPDGEVTDLILEFPSWCKLKVLVILMIFGLWLFDTFSIA